MAKKVESKFLIIEATASEFLSAGFGGGPVTDCGVISGGVFDGFSLIDVATGQEMICDFCNSDIKKEDTCYFVAVLNQILCKECFENWHRSAKFYPEDVPYEKKNYDRAASKLQKSQIGIDVTVQEGGQYGKYSHHQRKEYKPGQQGHAPVRQRLCGTALVPRRLEEA